MVLNVKTTRRVKKKKREPDVCLGHFGFGGFPQSNETPKLTVTGTQQVGGEEEEREMGAGR